MTLHQWGTLSYREAEKRMQEVHRRAVEDAENHLISCSHPEIFTVGCNDTRSWPVPVYRCSRGGSITAHSEGQAVLYFCFQAEKPALFYRNVLRAYDTFFSKLLPNVSYNKAQPGYYIENRKIASLGFRYSHAVSLHGVALNVDVDLAFHSQVNPCGLEGIVPTSLCSEGIDLTVAEVHQHLSQIISEVFGDPIVKTQG